MPNFFESLSLCFCSPGSKYSDKSVIVWLYDENIPTYKESIHTSAPIPQSLEKVPMGDVASQRGG